MAALGGHIVAQARGWDSADLTRFYDEFTARMRDILKDAGLKLVR